MSSDWTEVVMTGLKRFIQSFLMFFLSGTKWTPVRYGKTGWRQPLRWGGPGSCSKQGQGLVVFVVLVFIFVYVEDAGEGWRTRRQISLFLLLFTGMSKL